MGRELGQIELKEIIGKLRENAMNIHLCTSIMRTFNPEKTTAIEKVKSLSREIIDQLEIIEK